VLVAGGGPAGSAAALDLSRRGLSVALIEQDNYETFRVGETLPPMIRHQLTGLGIWQRFLECGSLESYGIQTAWETPALRYQDFLQNPYGCGWHVDRARFDAMLATAAAQAGAELMLGARVTSCHMTKDGPWRLEVSQGEKTHNLSGRILVDATGRRAVFAGRLGSQASMADQLIGVVTVSHGSETERCALIEAVENGWWYSAPLPGDRTVFAYMTDSDLWKSHPDWSDLMKLTHFTLKRAGKVEVPPSIHIVSAASIVHDPVTGPNWIAIGDAALAFDPLSGQGVFKSIDTGIRSSAIIARHLDGDSSVLAEYESWVKENYRSYLSERSRFYCNVSRWPASPFWMRRMSAI
jgi:flavin-dependent dehydrogenase